MKRMARRLLLLIPLLLAVMTFTFAVTRLAGGDPASQIAGPDATPETVAAISAQLGTDQPLLEQYVRYLGGIVRLDFGTSYYTEEPVFQALIDRLPATLEVVLLGMALAIVLGVGAGALAAWGRGRARDRAVRGISFGLLAIPEFWAALVLVFVFYFHLGWAPAPVGQIGALDPQPDPITNAVFLDALLTLDIPALQAAASYLVLPVLTVGILYAAPIARLTRSSVLEVLSSDYVRFAEACSVPRRTVFRYTIRASMAPVITFLGLLMSGLVGGSVLLEQVFSWGGASQFVAKAAMQGDYPVIQGFVLFAGVFSVIIFLTVDAILQMLDPRVRLEQS